MGKVKKMVIVSLTGVAGLLLTLAGFNLIQLSQNLIMYAGILLLILTIIIYFFG